MIHETARQRARRHKRDPYRAAVLAPSWTIPPARCVCGTTRLMHDASPDGPHAGRCLTFGCECTEYREVDG